MLVTLGQNWSNSTVWRIWIEGGVAPYRRGNRLGGRPKTSVLLPEGLYFPIPHAGEWDPRCVLLLCLTHTHRGTHARSWTPLDVWLSSSALGHSSPGDIWCWQFWPTPSCDPFRTARTPPGCLTHADCWQTSYGGSVLGTEGGGSLCCTLLRSFPPSLSRFHAHGCAPKETQSALICSTQGCDEGSFFPPKFQFKCLLGNYIGTASAHLWVICELNFFF